MGVEFHADKHGHAEAKPPTIDPRLVAGDVALLLKALYAAEARRRREANPFGKLDIAQPSILLQHRQDLAIQGVETDGGIFRRQSFNLRCFIALIVAYGGTIAMFFRLTCNMIG